MPYELRTNPNPTQVFKCSPQLRKKSKKKKKKQTPFLSGPHQELLHIVHFSIKKKPNCATPFCKSNRMLLLHPRPIHTRREKEQQQITWSTRFRGEPDAIAGHGTRDLANFEETLGTRTETEILEDDAAAPVARDVPRRASERPSAVCRRDCCSFNRAMEWERQRESE